MTRRVLPCICAGAALVVAVAESAAADAVLPLDTPIALGSPAAHVERPSLDALTGGTALVSWAARLAGDAPATDRVVLFARRPDGSLVQSTVRDDDVVRVVGGPRGIVVLRHRRPARPDRGTADLAVSVGRIAGRLGARRTVVRYPPPGEESSLPAIAASPQGAVAVGWVEAAGRTAAGDRRGFRLRVALRRRGSSAWLRRTVAVQQRSGDISQPRLAFHGRDALTVAYVRTRIVAGRRRRGVEVRLVRERARLAPAQVVGPARENQTEVRLATAPGGRTVVAWSNVHGTVMGFRSRYVVRAALRRRGTARFDAAQVLDPGDVLEAGAPGVLRAGMSDAGAATVAWSAFTSGFPALATEIRVAETPPDGRFGVRRTVASGGSNRLADLAVGGGGDAVVAWLSSSGTTAPEVRVALRPVGSAAFRSSRVVTTLQPQMADAVDPAPSVALDGGLGLAGVVWAQRRSAGEHPDGAPAGVHVRLLLMRP